MSTKNVYLELLLAHSKKIDAVIKNKDNYNTNVYNCILAGLVIQMNSIVEQCIMDFHSSSFSKVVELIYNSRQLLVHYSDYRTLKNMETISSQIIKEIKKSYKHEEKYFSRLLKFESISERNVVVSKSRDVIYDEFNNSYIFRNDDVEIAVSEDKVIKLQDLKKRRDVAYIVSCNQDMNYFKKNGNDSGYYQLIGEESVLSFFVENFKVIDVNYNKHKVAIRDILDNFYKEGNYNGVVTKQKVSVTGNNVPLYLDSSKVLDKFFNERIAYKQLMDERVYVNNGVPEFGYFDFHSLKQNVKEDLERNLTRRDYFFLSKTISMFNSLNETINENKDLDSDNKHKMIITMLINWSDHTLRHFSEKFIKINPEFEDLHVKLVNYRNFFSHNILQLKKSIEEKLIKEYLEMANGYIGILNSLNIEEVNLDEGKNEVHFIAIERDTNRFISRRYEQYVQIDPMTYVGNKLFYSTKGSEYRKIVGLIVADKKHAYRGSYYERKNGEFISKTFRTKGGRKRRVMVSKMDYSYGMDVSFDINCSDLFYLYAATKGKVDKHDNLDLHCLKKKRVVVFYPSKENNYRGHSVHLEGLITDFFQQRYMPFELVKPTKIVKVKDENDKGYFQIVDASTNEVIADVVDETKLEKYNVEHDHKGYFTINETIHNFRKVKH